MPFGTRLPFFYGWVIVGAIFVCFAVGYSAWHSFSIFYVAILREFGWDRAPTALALSVFTMVYGLAAPFAGGLVDRFGPRTVMPLAALLLGAGLLLTTRLTSLWEYYLLFGIIAPMGLCGFGVVPSYSVLAGWFSKKRGLAAGCATAGIGIGTMFIVPALQAVITSHGWRTAYVVLACAVILVVPALTFTFYRHRPRDLGLLPDGEKPVDGPPAGRAEQIRADVLIVDKQWASREWTLLSAARTYRFWAVLVARSLELLCLQIVLAHQAAFFVDMGFEAMVAASVVGIVGLVGSAGKILLGYLSDRIGREWSYTAAFGAGMVGIAILLTVVPGTPVAVLYAYAVIYGLCYAASAVLLPVLTADLFQGRRYGSILGGIYIGGGAGSAAGAFLGGYIFDVTRSYTLAFLLMLPLMGLCCLLYWLAGPRKVRLVAGLARQARRLQPEV